jgi:putative ABC transport system substrate-binding protein
MSGGRQFMKRREFMAAIGAAAWPLAAHAQQAPGPIIGFLSARSPGESAGLVAAFRQGLAQIGFVEGRNVAIEYRWAEGDYDRLPRLAAELVARGVAVIATFGSPLPALAAKAAAGAIPVVFTSADDPVGLGLVPSLNRPSGNTTGITTFGRELEPKRLELLRELVPNAALIAVLIKKDKPVTEKQLRDLEQAAQAFGLELLFLSVDNDSDLDAAFGTLVQRRAAALMVGADGFFSSRRGQLAALAARHSVPAIYSFRDYAVAGGLISYGSSLAGIYRQAALYVGRILKGENPADLPVLQPTMFELVINLNAARALGLKIPQNLLAIADELIE